MNLFESKYRKLIWLFLLCLFALLFFDDRLKFFDQHASDSSTALVKLTNNSSTQKTVDQVSSPRTSLDPLLPREKLYPANQHKLIIKDLFSGISWTPAPVKPIVPLEVLEPPPVPFSYIGKKVDGEIYEVYVTYGDKSLLLRDDSIIDNTYKVLNIAPPNLILLYLPMNKTQTFIIGDSR